MPSPLSILFIGIAAAVSRLYYQYKTAHPVLTMMRAAIREKEKPAAAGFSTYPMVGEFS